MQKQTRITLLAYAGLGAIIGGLILHPISQLIAFWSRNEPNQSLWTSNLVFQHLGSSLEAHMLPMTLLFVVLGTSVGLGFAGYGMALSRSRLAVETLASKLARDLPELLKQGESEFVEFKSSGRWDYRLNRINKDLETVMAKTIAGFMNHQGGDLIIGANDDGVPIGLEKDYETLMHKNRDGYERWIMATVKSRLGGHLCARVHCIFYHMDGKDLCRVIAEAAQKPVYVKDGKTNRYFARAGNSTRELDAKEAAAHIAIRR